MHARSPFLVPGLLAGLALWSGCSPAQATPQAAAAPVPTLKVETVEVKSEALPRTLALTGTLAPLEDASVAAGAAGKVLATDAERGQAVKKGHVLARLDARVTTAQAAEAAAAADVARAQAEVSRSECERSNALVAEGGVAMSQHERTLANCKVAQAQVTASDARARLSAAALSDMTIRAPFDGVVAERHVSVGEFVTQPSAVVTLVATGQLRLELTVPEASAADVHVGQTVSFSLSSNPSVRHEAKVSHVGPMVRRGSRDVVVEALVDNVDGKLPAGAFVQARLALDSAPVAVVPRAAVRQEGNQSRLFVVKDGALEERLVQLNDTAGERAGILRGVMPGERVVAQARPELRDGAKVE
ncbi:MAG: efflux RND transporter periplasmic adaptor subunit [Myxococcaceae bacterium]|nr:efflux RND transporter periplasmic adaptor subunit [Myxococcaceae bacterium]MCI0672599.1 efflux RND transporter periplasmic adaptor subunit [Myxococcaceae bacterium]